VAERTTRISLRGVALFYLLAILFVPVGLVFYRAFEPGLSTFIDAVTTPDALHALQLTFICTIVPVPLNTVFGIAAALYVVRGKGPGRRALDAIIDLPFAISPVVVGLALVLVYGENGWFGKGLTETGFQVIFALPGMILATTFVCLPFVAREVIPVLRELGDEQEQAARTLGANGWQTLTRITLPSIKWALGYGVVLTTARAIGEFGAVSVVSGHLVGQTDTATLYVANQFENFNLPVAYSVSVVLAIAALVVIVGMTTLQHRQERRGVETTTPEES
jgi:sulfate transport system permease protein